MFTGIVQAVGRIVLRHAAATASRIGVDAGGLDLDHRASATASP